MAPVPGGESGLEGGDVCGKVTPAVSTEGVCVGLHARVGSSRF